MGYTAYLPTYPARTLELLKKLYGVHGDGPKRLFRAPRTHTHTTALASSALQTPRVYILRFNLHVSLVFVHFWEYNSQTSVYLKFKPIHVHTREYIHRVHNEYIARRGVGIAAVLV